MTDSELANDFVEEFNLHGKVASYHYSDDTGKEWVLGDRHKTLALIVVDSHPDLQPEMREAAKGFLWSLSMERPE